MSDDQLFHHRVNAATGEVSRVPFTEAEAREHRATQREAQEKHEQRLREREQHVDDVRRLRDGTADQETRDRLLARLAGL